ncbi:hypothetical protein [Arthrobacter pascens]|uniref:hypothetical protein n=1 Tax=Arthrobacter pascens TaxID=1677 RepID=UPI0027D7CA87|nr:hypothetical protein [Arthrobacter pascens]
MTEHAQATVRKMVNWPARIILMMVAILVLVIAYFALAAVLPIWWANVIRNQVQGNLGVGILVGMFYGFVFTFVPLMVAWQATGKAIKWPWKIALILLAVVLATPNLLTAAIMISNSTAAHNGQRILGTEATWFPLWTQISAVAAVAIFVVGLILWTNWRQRGKKVKALKKADAERALASQAAEAEARDANAADADGRAHRR